MICTGRGDERVDPFDGGCCFVAGAVCPLRYFISYTTPPSAWGGLTDQQKSDLTAAATILDDTETPVVFANGTSTVDGLARQLVGNSPPQRQRVYDQLQGKLYVCQAAVSAVQVNFNTIVVSPTEINGPAFEAAWNADPLYTTARPLPDGTNRSLFDYWSSQPGGLCSQWQGTSRSQCCFAEDQATNDAKRTAMTQVAVTIASRSGG